MSEICALQSESSSLRLREPSCTVLQRHRGITGGFLEKVGHVLVVIRFLEKKQHQFYLDWICLIDWLIDCKVLSSNTKWKRLTVVRGCVRRRECCPWDSPAPRSVRKTPAKREWPSGWKFPTEWPVASKSEMEPHEHHIPRVRFGTILYCPAVFGHCSPAPVKIGRAVRIQ